MHLILSLSQPLILGMDFMLDYELVPNALRLTAELLESLNFTLERPASRVFALFKVVTAETVTVPVQ